MIFNTFYTTDLPEFVISDHKACCQKLGIQVVYHPHDPKDDFDAIYKAHGEMINKLLRDAKNNETVCFLDIDCLPYSLIDLKAAYEWASINKSFIGNAQNISHNRMKNRPYAAASMIMIHKKAWLDLGKPNMSFYKFGEDQVLIDTCQQLSINADDLGFSYRLLLPIGYDDPQRAWQLGPWCAYGGGTAYPGNWHYFRISDLKNYKPQIWKERVQLILEGKELIPKFNSLTSKFEKYKPWYKRLF